MTRRGVCAALVALVALALIGLMVARPSTDSASKAALPPGNARAVAQLSEKPFGPRRVAAAAAVTPAPGRRLLGSVRAEGAALVAGASVCIIERQRPIEPRTCSTSDAEGHFELADVEPLPIDLFASASGYLSAHARVEGDASSHVTLILRTGGVDTRVSVLDALGGPIVDALVMGQPWSAEDPVVTAVTDAAGLAILRVPLGQVRVSASAEGYARVSSVIRAPSWEHIVLAPAATVSGRVVAAATREPVSGVSILATSIGAVGPRGQSVATSDDAGEFRLERLVAGTYELRGSSVVSRTEPATLTVGIGEAVGPIELVAEAATSVSGQLRVAGEPCAGTVQATGPSPLFAATGPDGAFELLGVAPGKYEFVVDCPAAYVQHEAISVGSEPVSRVWDLDAGLALRGSVETASGARVARARVDLFPVSDGTVSSAHARQASCLTDERGEFLCSGLRAGSYDASASVEGQFGDEPLRVSVGEPGSTSWLALRLKPAATIIVRFAGSEPSSMGAVGVYARGADGVVLAATYEGEHFALRQIALGKYELFPGSSPDFPGGSRTAVELEHDGQVEDVTLTSGERMAMQGRIVDAHGAAVPDAWVRVSNPDVGWDRETAPPVLSDDEGTFFVPDLLPGQYDLHVSQGDRFAVAKALAGAAALQIRLNDAAAISGRVVTEGGDAVSEFSVVCEALDASQGPTRAQALGRNGQWSLTRLLPGKYRITVSSEWGDGETNVVLQPGTAVDSFVSVAKHAERLPAAQPSDAVEPSGPLQPSSPSESSDGAQHKEG